MNKEEHRQRVLEALNKGAQTRVVHPSIPLMPEDVRRLTEEFGHAFGLWPSIGTSAFARKARARWAEVLRECARHEDGRAINPAPYWQEIANEGEFSVSGPWSTIKTIRAKDARRKHRPSRGILVEPPEGWIPKEEEK